MANCSVNLAARLRVLPGRDRIGETGNITHGRNALRRVGAQPQAAFTAASGGKCAPGWIEIENVEQVVRARGITIRGDEVRSR